MENFWIEAIGYAGTALNIASLSMRTIIPLRIVGVFSSLCFIIYGALIGSWPIIITDLIILPLNVIRLAQVTRLLDQVKQASDSNLSLDMLDPYAHTVRYRAGEVVFAAGDASDYLLMIRSGQFRLKEADILLGENDIVGEMGFISPENARTMTLECVLDGEAGKVSYFDIRQLYYQNPQFGFAFMRLITNRLFQNIDRARAAAIAGAPLSPGGRAAG